MLTLYIQKNVYNSFEDEGKKFFISTRNLQKFMEDYSLRYSDQKETYAIIKRSLIETENYVQYVILILLSNSLIFTVYIYYITKDAGFLIIPIIIISFYTLLLYIIFIHWVALSLRSIIYVITRNIAIFVLVLLLYISAFLQYGDYFPRAISDISVHISLAGICFSFTIGLFLILGLNSLLKRTDEKLDNIKLSLTKFFDTEKIITVTQIYAKDNMKDIYEQYTNAIVTRRCLHNLTISSGLFALFGFRFIQYTLKNETYSMQANILTHISSDVSLFYITGLLIFFTFINFYLLVNNEVLYPPSKLELQKTKKKITPARAEQVDEHSEGSSGGTQV